MLFRNEWRCLEERFIKASCSKDIFGSHYMKSICIKSFSGLYFHAFRLNTEIFRISPYSVRMRENADQKNSEYGRFCAVNTLENVAALCQTNVRIPSIGNIVSKFLVMQMTNLRVIG